MLTYLNLSILISKMEIFIVATSHSFLRTKWDIHNLVQDLEILTMYSKLLPICIVIIVVAVLLCPWFYMFYVYKYKYTHAQAHTHIYSYSWSLNNSRVRAPTPVSQKSTYNFWPPKNSPPNTSLTNNINTASLGLHPPSTLMCSPTQKLK